MFDLFFEPLLNKESIFKIGILTERPVMLYLNGWIIFKAFLFSSDHLLTINLLIIDMVW